jgi:flagellar hook-associated protein 2
MSMGMRITGTNSGLDVDALVTASMKPYKARVDKEVQNRKVLEYQQEQYRTIMNDASDFYDKYFDVLKTGNMISPTTYQTQTYTASPNGTVVTAKGLAGASLDNYSVNVTQLAAKASDELLSSETGEVTITIGNTDVKFTAASDGNVTVANYNAEIAKKKLDLTDKIKTAVTDADKLQYSKQLADLNNNTVTAKYSEFSGKVVFTASAFGGDGFKLSSTSKTHDKAEDKYLEATVSNGKGEVYTITSADKKTSNTVVVDNVQFDFKGVSASTTSASTAHVSPVTEVADDLAFGPLTALEPLGESDGATSKTTASDGTITTVTTSGTKTTTTVLSPDKTTNVKTVDTASGMTTETSANGVTTITKTDVTGTTTTVKYGKEPAVSTTTTKVNADGTSPITREIIKDSYGTTTTTTTLKDGNKTTVKKEVTNGASTVTTTNTEEKTTSGSIVTETEATNGTVTKQTTTQIKMASGTTTKTVTVSDGAQIAEVTPVAELIALTDDGVNTKTVNTVGGVETTTLTAANGTKTEIAKVLADGKITTTTATDGRKTVVSPDGTKTTTQYAADGTTKTYETAIATDGTKTTIKYAADGTTQTDKTVIATDGTVTTTKYASDGATKTYEAVKKADGTITTNKYEADGTTIKATYSTTSTATTYSAPTTLSGSTDISGLKDKIVSFVNDYNKLLLEINTKLYETRDKDYMPLTDEQKKSMSEDQIKAWEKKAQTGLLRKDFDLEKIANEMKSAMATVVSGSGLSLEKIGISPVKNYTDKNGMLTIDESKLTTALEDNGGDVRDLFTRASSSTDKGGALTQLKSAVYSEFKKSNSSLSKKAGLVGSSTESDNTISNNISKKKKLITQLNTQLSTRENALYKKYSALETAMEKLNAQKSSLASMLGQG